MHFLFPLPTPLHWNRILQNHLPASLPVWCKAECVGREVRAVHHPLLLWRHFSAGECHGLQSRKSRWDRGQWERLEKEGIRKRGRGRSGKGDVTGRLIERKHVYALEYTLESYPSLLHIIFNFLTLFSSSIPPHLFSTFLPFAFFSSLFPLLSFFSFLLS